MICSRKFKMKIYFTAIVISGTFIIFQILSKAKEMTFKKLQHLQKINKQATYNNYLKFILLWNRTNRVWENFEKGQISFIKNDCSYHNCFITDDRNLLQDDYANFEAILFDGKEISCVSYNTSDLPKRKQTEQTKFIFTATESAAIYPVCNYVFDDFFDLSFTYRLDSDIVFEYFTIYDINNNTAVGPKENMEWISDSNSLSNELSNKINDKSIAVAWIVSNCFTESKREQFAFQLKSYLQLFNLTMDIIGECGDMDCPRTNHIKCIETLETYYFYMSLENSFAYDYVTEKILNAVLSTTVPIVYGGANYSRFLPPNSYLDGRRLGVEKTASRIYELINNKTAYTDFFRWRNRYVYRYATRPTCALCEILNKGWVNKNKYKNFRQWWNPKYEKCNKYKV